MKNENELTPPPNTNRHNTIPVPPLSGPPVIPPDIPAYARDILERMDRFSDIITGRDALLERNLDKLKSVHAEISASRTETQSLQESVDQLLKTVQYETSATRRLAQEAADDVRSLREDVRRSNDQNAQQNSTLQALIFEIKALRTHVQVPEGYRRNGLTGMRLLLVEDDALLAETLERQLRQRGAEVTVVASAEHARELAAGPSVYDSALVDIGLPGEDGVSLAHWLRGRDVHVVLTTGFHQWKISPTEQVFKIIRKPARDLDEIVDALRKKAA